MKRYPFKFLDSYGKEDISIFFGRDEEIEDLYEMVFQSPIILVYGASGTGKTSLIQCGLASKFETHDWLPITVRRGNNINESLEKVLNAETGPEISDELKWLNEFAEPVVLKSQKTIQNPVISNLKSVYRNTFKPVYLIFDQFEELFIFGTKEEQRDFVNTIREILMVQQPVRMIFSIREEYLGELFDFEKAVPLLTQKKLRIEPMGLDKVRQFIHGVTDQKKKVTNVRLKKGEEDLIPETIFKIIKGERKERGIQLPYLQVFLDKLYMNITNDKSRKAEAEISMADVEHIKDIGDVLRDLLEEQAKLIFTELHPGYPELSTDTIWKILSPFVTLKGTKEPISKHSLYERLPDIQPAVINAVVEKFVNGRILRYSESNDLYEISHDALGRPIALKRSAEDIAILEIRRLIESQSSFKEEARLFNEKQISFIEPYLEKLKLSAEEQKLISDSIHEIEKNKKRQRTRLTYTFIAIGIVFFGLLALLIYAFNQKEINTKQARELQATLTTKDSIERRIGLLNKEKEDIFQKTTEAQYRFKTDSLNNSKRLARLTDSINRQIALSVEKFNRFSNDVFVGKINSVIALMKSANYDYFDMPMHFSLINSKADQIQRETYISILRDSINVSTDLTFKVRALFYLHNATENMSVLDEIMEMLLNNYRSINDQTISEIRYQTEFRYSTRVAMYANLRLGVLEKLLEGKREGLVKLANSSYTRLLPTIDMDSSDSAVFTNQVMVPPYVLYFENINNYFEAIAIALEMVNGKVTYQHEVTYALQDLRHLNKFIFCSKLVTFLGSPALTTSQLSDILRMLPNRNSSSPDYGWNKYEVFGIPSTTDKTTWDNWAKEHPEIVKLHAENNLDSFKTIVSEYWNTHKKSYRK